MISANGENLVFLLSMPRSGSTLLSLLLGSHSDVLCPPEPWFLLKLAALPEFGNHHNLFDERLATIGSKNFLPPEILIEASRRFAATAYNAHLQKVDKTIFVDKTPRYYHILSFIDNLFPQAKKIWLKRNPLDVAASYKTTWHLSVEQIVGQKFNENSFDFAVGLFNLATYFQSPSPLKFELQYEQLVHAPAQTLSVLCQFLDIPFQPQMLAYAQNPQIISDHKSTQIGDKKVLTTSKIHTRSVRNWPNKLAQPEIEQLANLLGFDIFRQMGYHDVLETLTKLGFQPPAETKAAELRYQVSHLTVNKVKQLEREANYLRNSWSWKITEPFRLLARIVRWQSIKKLITPPK